MPRSPTGPRAMTSAERQARRRERYREMQAEVERLRDHLDTLEMHGNPEIQPGWVCVPVGEWEQIFPTDPLARQTPCHTSSGQQEE